MQSLINFLKTNKNTRRIFGKKELEIMFKQINGLKLTQSEKNRLSRDIRPKFEFIKEANSFKDEFRLKKNQDNKKIIENAVEKILNDELKENIKAILLFGSFADNSFTKRSDIDICVLFKEDLTKKQASKFRIRILGELPDRVDIQVFNVLPQKIKRSIAKTHTILYKTNEFDNMEFSIKYLKDIDYFIRMQKIFGAAI